MVFNFDQFYNETVMVTKHFIFNICSYRSRITRVNYIVSIDDSDPESHSVDPPSFSSIEMSLSGGRMSQCGCSATSLRKHFVYSKTIDAVKVKTAISTVWKSKNKGRQYFEDFMKIVGFVGFNSLHSILSFLDIQCHLSLDKAEIHCCNNVNLSFSVIKNYRRFSEHK